METAEKGITSLLFGQSDTSASGAFSTVFLLTSRLELTPFSLFRENAFFCDKSLLKVFLETAEKGITSLLAGTATRVVGRDSNKNGKFLFAVFVRKVYGVVVNTVLTAS